MKIFFLGNHTVGVRVLEEIIKTQAIVGVVAHPPDPEDGVKYLSVYDFAIHHSLKVIRSDAKGDIVQKLIDETKPDLLWVTDYRYLLPNSLIRKAPLGAVNFHPSLLPKYRGRAPINWAILNGETELGLTVHFIDEGMDSGDIIAQQKFTLTQEQDVGDALEMLYPIYQELTLLTLRFFESGQVPRAPQDHLQATSYPKRRPKDGLIDWELSASHIHNFVRALARPYPGAFTYLGDQKIIIWKSYLGYKIHDSKPGQVISNDSDNSFCVACGEGTLKVIGHTFKRNFNKLISIHAGDTLTKKHAEQA